MPEEIPRFARDDAGFAGRQFGIGTTALSASNSPLIVTSYAGSPVWFAKS
jgi:hypothetical protein